MTLEILARSDDWVVIAKPPNLLVHRTPIAKQDRVFALQIARDQLGQHVFPVSRLDRPASGCLIFGLSSEAARDMHGAMKEPSAVKTYLAHVRGEWTHGEGRTVIERPMKDDNGRLKDARTEAECIGTTDEPRSSLVRAYPTTGRYHQVRRHLRDLNHPVLVDPQHGDSKMNREWRARGLPRLALHCARLDLPLPNGERLTVSCPPFEDLAAIWRTLPWWKDAVAREPLLAQPTLPLPDFDGIGPVSHEVP